MLEDNGVEIISRPGPFNDEELSQLVAGHDALIVGVDEVGEKTAGRADKLRVIAKNGVGVDNIYVPAATEKGIVVTRAIGSNTVSVAEFTFSLILSVTKNLVKAANATKAGIWSGSKFSGTELADKTLGIIGLGSIGKRVARYALGFDMKVIYFDVVRQDDFEQKYDVHFVTLETLLRESDIVDVHVPLEKATREVIGRNEFELMKESAYLVNTSRGAVIDEDALYQALREGKIAGAATDVYTKEPPGACCHLFSLDSCLTTPHMAGYTMESNERMGTMVAMEILRVLRGERPQYALNYDEIIGSR